MKRQILDSIVKAGWLLALLSVVLVFGDLTAAVPASTPTIASDAGGSIAEIRMLDATNGWAWSNGLDGQNLPLRTTDGGQTWSDVTPRAFPYTSHGPLSPVVTRGKVTAVWVASKTIRGGHNEPQDAHLFRSHFGRRLFKR